MRRLGPTVDQLARYRKRWDEMVALANDVQTSAGPGSGPGRLAETPEFGANPGNLRMWSYAPDALDPEPALVVVLHGCRQSAGGYDEGAGWSVLADRFGFAVLFPEQQAANNPNNCFNWFQPGDTARGRGEAHSIRQMVEAMVVRHGIDQRRIFVTGLSAGGAMTSVMLATYPDVFAGGAIIAGLPYRSARSVSEALDCMFQGTDREASAWGDLVRGASRHRGPWPTVSVWHGTADATVKPTNAREIIKQWTDVHGLSPQPSEEGVIDGYPRAAWRGADGRVLVEAYEITGMAHGTPIATGPGENAVGAAGPFLLDVGISSSYRIAESWGLTGEAKRPGAASKAPVRDLAPDAGPVGAQAPKEPAKHGLFDIGGEITRALRAAGLMKG
jgi:feruloyl esterase